MREEKAQNVVYLILDYDNCTDVLFPELNSFADLKTFINQKPVLTKERIGRKKLGLLLDSITIGADEVVVGVGSNRQSKWIDDNNTLTNKTGSCFTNFKNLCQEKKWIFCEYLLSDLDSEIPLGLRGKAMFANPNLCTKGRTDIGIKVEILKMHMDIAKTVYPNSNVTFVFIDDDYKNILFPALEREILNNNDLTLLSKKWSIQFFKFDYFPRGQMDEQPRFFHTFGLPKTLYGKDHSFIL